MKHVLLSGIIPVNSYLIEDGNDCYVIDPGYQKHKLHQIVEERNLNVKAILLTHGHFDHIGAVDAFDVPVYVHEEDYGLMFNEDANFFKAFNRTCPFDMHTIDIRTFKGETSFQLNDLTIDVVHTPGHTMGCVCYRTETNLYTGDTLFFGAVGRCDFPEADIMIMKKTILKLMDSMPDHLNVYPGHGPSTTIGHERQTNPYYLKWLKSLQTSET